MTLPNIYIKGDRIIWIVVLLLSLISILAVYTSSGKLAYARHDGNTEHFLVKQIVLVLSGLSLMYVTHLANYKIFSRIGQIALVVAVPLLILTLFTGEVNNASRWLSIPVFDITFQTSDLAKLALILFLARQLSRKQEQVKSFKEGFLPLMVPIGTVCVLILPANFSTAAILFATSMVLLYIGRVSLKYIGALIGSALLIFALFITIALTVKLPGRIGTWQNRIESFMDKDSEGNYQPEKAKMAIASGGITGLGIGHSEQRNFLPQSESDFIYAIIIEEGGLIVGGFVMLLYMILLLRVVRMVKYSPQTYATFLAVGCCLLIMFQAMINMAVAVNLFPVTGQTLPLVSMGGSSMWFTSISIGIILCVSKYCTPDNTQTADAE
ncbi:MAG: FtsW/RodA/SpoVE family cell cycle protein [Bacteroidia bacterium]|jgi:cell division protein FtsW|nr:FtsW/RodA/SpoVE family cell cycle protein [Bacteroidia bacterium]MCC6767875.1 FtsW/RodA/SpoVE family cell cycle protein [Bacteroidia bacterium]